VTPIPGPTAKEQVAFLGKVERILSEGQFVGTYKFALLLAIADLAVKLGSDDGSELDLPIRAIAEEFIELYWRQGAPYGNSVADGAYSILQQNTGRQAAIISIVNNLRQAHGTLMRARQSAAWTAAVNEGTRLVKDMPLWRLQRLRNEVLDFLYAESPVAGNIRLKKGGGRQPAPIPCDHRPVGAIRVDAFHPSAAGELSIVGSHLRSGSISVWCRPFSAAADGHTARRRSERRVPVLPPPDRPRGD